MKKFNSAVVLSLSLVLALSLGACSKRQTPVAQGATPEVPKDDSKVDPKADPKKNEKASIPAQPGCENNAALTKVPNTYREVRNAKELLELAKSAQITKAGKKSRFELSSVLLHSEHFSADGRKQSAETLFDIVRKSETSPEKVNTTIVCFKGVMDYHMDAEDLSIDSMDSQTGQYDYNRLSKMRVSLGKNEISSSKLLVAKNPKPFGSETLSEIQAEIAEQKQKGIDVETRFYIKSPTEFEIRMARIINPIEGENGRPKHVTHHVKTYRLVETP